MSKRSSKAEAIEKSPMKGSNRGTALNKYQRLESLGLWRERPEDQRREVAIRMGEATLTIFDPRSDQALSHWSLPAIERLNPGQTPALFAPGDDSPESIEITDGDMLDALKLVQSAVWAQRRHPGRLRGWLLGGAALIVLGLGLTFVPGLLNSHTAKVVPAAKHPEIGRAHV